MKKKISAFIILLFPFLLISSGTDSGKVFVEFSVNPGTYNQTQSLQVKNFSQGLDLFYSIPGDFEEAAPLLPFTKTLELSALEGEYREYKIKVHLYVNRKKVEEKRLTYIIDRRGPGAPGIDTAPGEYKEDKSVLFEKNGVQALYYSINNEGDDVFWDGKAIKLSATEGALKEYILKAYTLDNVGNKSEIKSFKYIIDKTAESKLTPALSVISPPAGSFANKQLLVVKGTNTSWIKYTTDGRDPQLYGTYYQGPVLLDKTGSITLKLTALPRWKGEAAITEEVKFTVTEESTDPVTVDMGSGVYGQDFTVNLSRQGVGRFFYTLDGTTPSKIATISPGDISLKGSDGKADSIDLRFKALLDNGDLSGEYRYYYIIDKRTLYEPDIKASTLKIGKEPVTLQIKGPEKCTLYYTTDGYLPHTGSSVTSTGSITVDISQVDGDGAVVVKAIAVDSSGKTSAVALGSVFFEVITGNGNITTEMESPIEVGSSILISLQNEGKYVYEISSDGTPPGDPDSGSPAAAGSISISIPSGMEKKFIIKVGTLEGSRVVSIRTYHYILDKQPPLNPEISGLPDKGLSNGTVTLAFEENPEKIYYQLTDDNTSPVIMANMSPRYLFPVKISGVQDKDVTYRINAIAVDEWNNVSSMLYEESFRIDKLLPQIPLEPVLASYGSPVERKYSLYWEEMDNLSIFFRVRDNYHINEQFVRYSSPVLIDFSQIEGGTLLECYRQDDAGNTSKTVVYKIDPSDLSSVPPAITGVRDRGLYNKRVVVRFLAPAGEEVHYEMSNDGSDPLPVRYDSPLAGRMLVLDVEEGMKVTYRIKARSFLTDVRDITNPENEVTFTIDKEAPVVPVLVGAGDGSHYYEGRTITFHENEGQVYYSVLSGEDYRSPGFNRFSGPVAVDVKPGEMKRFTVTAFSMDDAGNVSRRIAVWSFAVDRQGVYMSADGNDLYEGTRERPFKTLTRTLDYLLESGRSKIYISSGNFYIDRSLKIASDLEIAGGFDPMTWSLADIGSKSRIITAAPFKKGDPVLEVLSGQVGLSRLSFSDPLNGCDALIELSGGQLSLNEVEMLPALFAGSRALDVKEAGLNVKSSVFSSENQYPGSFLTASGGNILLENSIFNGPQKGDSFICLTVKDNALLELVKATVNPGAGSICGGISAVGSRLKIKNSRISSGAAEENSVAVNLKNSKLEMEGSIINCRSDSRYSAGILGKDSGIRLMESVVNVDAQMGATGIKLSGGEINMFRSHLKGNTTEEFLYLANITGGNGSFVNNVILGADSGDSLCVVLDGGSTDWVNNTVIAGRGSNYTLGFMIKGEYRSDIINNIIVREGFDEGSALRFIGRGSVKSLIKNNNFAGWKYVMEVDSVTGGDSVYSSLKIGAVKNPEELNKYDEDPLGGNIHGNIGENYFKTFKISLFRDHHLSSFSACVNAGLDLKNSQYEDILFDIDGEPRPAPDIGIKPVFDIGADEYSGKESSVD